jgi:hypothetical protein
MCFMVHTYIYFEYCVILYQGLPDFSKQRAKFTLSYPPAGCKVLKEELLDLIALRDIYI